MKGLQVDPELTFEKYMTFAKKVLEISDFQDRAPPPSPHRGSVNRKASLQKSPRTPPPNQ
jgi:hypothetical protein